MDTSAMQSKQRLSLTQPEGMGWCCAGRFSLCLKAVQHHRLLAMGQCCADIAVQFASGPRASEMRVIGLFASALCHIFKGV